MVKFVRHWSADTGICVKQWNAWLGISDGKFFAWCKRVGTEHHHNGKIPRDHWLQEHEKAAILRFQAEWPLEGYRRLAYMLIDAKVAAASPATVYRVLRAANVIDKSIVRPSKKGTGFHQPMKPHEHWHCDISYINIAGTFFYLCSVLDGYSRAIVHWDIRMAMKDSDVQQIIQRGLEKYPHASPRLISDNGPQFVAREFKSFIRESGMTHVKTSPFYPQSNGKIEAWHKTVKKRVIRPHAPNTIDEALRLMTAFVEHYNGTRLHSSLRYVTPQTVLDDKQNDVWAARRETLAQAQAMRRRLYAMARQSHGPEHEACTV